MTDETKPQDSAAMPPASAGSQPVAWIVDGGKISYAPSRLCLLKHEATNLVYAFGGTVCPLFRSPALTEAERECLEWAEELAGNCEEFDRVNTLRNLLERTK
jgi:hypothetical protein